LTSSTTSYFSPEHDDGLPRRSIDGLYHPNPPQYRYGFTPGGQYVDFFNLPTFCTTSVYKFQRKNLLIKVDDELTKANQEATRALKDGNKRNAQRILEAAAGE
jgi:hypothetical protein